MARVALKLFNGVFSTIIELMILCAVLFAGYSIWDNSQIYRDAKNVQEQIRGMKPEPDDSDGTSFEELQNLNDDVVAWITVNGTNIDYPVLLGEDNLEYLNKDIYGEFSLAGSIYLDSRNKPDFSDNYSLIYGHNMEKHLMFGDLALFKDNSFFRENTDAELILPENTKDYKVAAILQMPAGTDEIFNPSRWENSLKGLGDFLKENSIWFHSYIIDELNTRPDNFEALTLVTCSDGNTNDRTVLVLIREKDKVDSESEGQDTSGSSSSSGSSDITESQNTSESQNISESVSDSGNTEITTEEQFTDNTSESEIGGNGPKPTGDGQNPRFWYYVIFGALIFIFLFETAERIIKRKINQ